MSTVYTGQFKRHTTLTIIYFRSFVLAFEKVGLCNTQSAKMSKRDSEMIRMSNAERTVARARRTAGRQFGMFRFGNFEACGRRPQPGERSAPKDRSATVEPPSTSIIKPKRKPLMAVTFDKSRSHKSLH